MGDQGVGRTAFKRIDKFNDDKTEQVWELFQEEFATVLYTKGRDGDDRSTTTIPDPLPEYAMSR